MGAIDHCDDRRKVAVSQLKVAAILIAIIIGSALVRLGFFTGMTLGDDVFYATQSYAIATGTGWPPEPYHWHTRLGVVLPSALVIRLLGPTPIAFILPELITSLLGILVCYFFASELFGIRAGLIAALLQATNPFDIIYSTHLFPDVPVSLITATALWAWIRFLRMGGARNAILVGICFGLGYLWRETILMDIPVFLMIWLYYGLSRNTRLLWVVGIPLAILIAECLLYGVITADPLYRWHAVARQQSDTTNLDLIHSSQSGGDFWTDPLIMLFTSHEFGLLMATALIVSPFVWRRWNEARPVILWLVVGFFWTYYGTTKPTTWLTLQRDPRYAGATMIAATIILARCIASLSLLPRISAVILTGLVGVAGAALDLGSTVLWPHSRLKTLPQVSECVLEPFEYFGLRWVTGLEKPTPAICGTDLGRASVRELLAHLPSVRFGETLQARMVLISGQRRPDLKLLLESERWVLQLSISGTAPPLRKWIASLLARVPSQEERAARMANPPGLELYRCPSRHE